MSEPTGRWNGPPNWPVPPSADWTPPPGWNPDPKWGKPPKGWQFYGPGGSAPIYGMPPKKSKKELRIALALGVILLFGIIIAASSGSKSTPTPATATDPLTTTAPAAPVSESPAPAPVPTAQAPVAAPPADAGKPNDKGWVLQSFQPANDGLGDFGGTARITNTNDSEKTATFTITLARSGTQVGSLQGSAQQVAAGKTVTVQLISQDKYSADPVTSDFQTDISY